MRYIFCLGPPRSGTTLLYGILTGGHVHGIMAECSHITMIMELYERLHLYSDSERIRYFGRDEKRMQAHFRALVHSILTDTYDTASGKNEILVLKDPVLTNHIDLIPQFFDQFKCVAVVRSPLDVVASLVNVQRKKQDGMSFDEIVEYAFQFYSRLTNTKIEADKLLVLRYEDIVDAAQHKAVQSKLEQFVGYRIEEYGFSAGGASFDVKDDTFSKNYGKEITNNSVNKYKSVLTDEEKKRVVKTFYGIFKRFKYA
jgi:hypothetical protein